jgi:hypothetical protein
LHKEKACKGRSRQKLKIGCKSWAKKGNGFW